jgi:alpha-beta hydrolase superfamily lysophospholipase
MSAGSPSQSPGTNPVELAEVIYFNSGEHRLFGWLHAPRQRARVGLVICNPFGYEGICSHRSVRKLADAAASAGVPALRFDYTGTGDSSDLDPHADQIERWIEDITAAAGELQTRTGVERVCLLGLRLGALLAALAAARCPAVHSLVLMAPVISGQRYLRDLRTTLLASSIGSNANTVQPVERSETGHAPTMEVSGFSLSAASITALKTIDLATSALTETLHVTDILVIDRNDLPTAYAWTERMASAGTRTEYHRVPGLIGMLMTDPQFAATPAALLQTFVEWLARTRGELTDGGGVDPPAPQGKTSLLSLTLPGDGSANSRLTERPIFLRGDTVIFGVVTEPRQAEIRRRAVILLNVGAEHHVGSSRIHVSLARRWACHGYTVLRLDLAGVGDSGTRPSRPEDEVFPPSALQDVSAAIDFIRSQYGIVDITLGGLCSGGYHSLRAAVAGFTVNRVLIVNPMNFFWKEGMTAESLQYSVDVARDLGFYRERLLSLTIWKRILTGNLDVRRLVRIVLKRPLLTLESFLRDAARRMRIPLPNDLGRELEQIAARGVRVVFVFSRGEPGIDLLKMQGGSSVKRLGESCRIHIINSADHIFTRSGQRAILESILSDELFARNQQRITLSKACELDVST